MTAGKKGEQGVLARRGANLWKSEWAETTLEEELLMVFSLKDFGLVQL